MGGTGSVQGGCIVCNEMPCSGVQQEGGKAEEEGFLYGYKMLSKMYARYRRE